MKTWLNDNLLSLILFLVGGAISAIIWVTSTYATIGYVDKGRSEDREMLQEMRSDIKQLLKREP